MSELSFTERLNNTGRNDVCSCGSGKKYKKCHLPADEEAQRKALLKEQEARNKEAKENENTDEENNTENKNKSGHDAFKNVPQQKKSKSEKISTMRRRKVI